MNVPRKPLVLISDDEPLLVSALAREAKRVGFSFLADTTAERVLDLAREHKPDLVILDIHQNVDGRDLLSKLKRDPATKDIKVLVLSGVEDEFTRRLCLALGAEDYAVKPFGPEFMNRIARMVRPEAAAPA